MSGSRRLTSASIVRQVKRTPGASNSKAATRRKSNFLCGPVCVIGIETIISSTAGRNARNRAASSFQSQYHAGVRRPQSESIAHGQETCLFAPSAQQRKVREFFDTVLPAKAELIRDGRCVRPQWVEHSTASICIRWIPATAQPRRSGQPALTRTSVFRPWGFRRDRQPFTSRMETALVRRLCTR
jgi:hypothetical protein